VSRQWVIASGVEETASIKQFTSTAAILAYWLNVPVPVLLKEQTMARLSI